MVVPYKKNSIAFSFDPLAVKIMQFSQRESILWTQITLSTKFQASTVILKAVGPTANFHFFIFPIASPWNFFSKNIDLLKSSGKQYGQTKSTTGNPKNLVPQSGKITKVHFSMIFVLNCTIQILNLQKFITFSTFNGIGRKYN